MDKPQLTQRQKHRITIIGLIIGAILLLVLWIDDTTGWLTPEERNAQWERLNPHLTHSDLSRYVQLSSVAAEVGTIQHEAERRLSK